MYSWILELLTTAFKRSQAKYVKGSYGVTNWPEYEAGLQQRGSPTVWISEVELKGWGPPRHGRRKPGGQVQYSNHAIEIALTVGMVFHLIRPVHLLVDSTGLSIHVGNLRKPTKDREWRKLHIAVNAHTGEIIASDLTSKRATDASRVPALIKEINRPLASVCADGAYDSEAVYTAVENHTKDRSTRGLIPPKKNARVRPATPTTRQKPDQAEAINRT